MSRRLALLTVLAMLFFPPFISAKTLNVASDGSGEFDSIQRAIEAAAAGDVVHVKAGTYRESLRLKGGVRVIGEDREKVRVEGRQGNTLIGQGISGVEVSGLTLIGTRGERLAAVWLSEVQQVTLRDCRVSDAGLSGIEVRASDDVRIEGCAIRANKEAGLFIQETRAARVSRNEIRDNNFQGVILLKTQAEVTENIIAHNRAAGLYVADGSEALIKGNLIQANQLSGIEVSAAQGRLIGNTLVGNRVIAIQFGRAASGEAFENIAAENDIGLSIETGGEAKIQMGYNNIAKSRRHAYAKTEEPPAGQPGSASGGQLFPAISLKPKTDTTFDPLFVDAESGDFRLVADSPLADAGRSGGPLGAFPAVALPGMTSVVDRIPKPVAPAAKRDAYGLVIGIGQYRDKTLIPPIPYARQDAETVAQYLTAVAGVPKANIKLLLDDKAGMSDLTAFIEEWLPKRVGPGSTVYLYYAGHGSPNTKEGAGAFLVPYDGDPDFSSKLYPLKRLYEVLDRLPATEVVVMLDSCFSGAGGRSVIPKGSRPMFVTVESPVLASGRLSVLAAATGTQISSDYDRVGHGLFTYYLLRGLRGEADADGNKEVGLGELYTFVSSRVAKKAAADLNREQTPVLQPTLELLGPRAGQPVAWTE